MMTTAYNLILLGLYIALIINLLIYFYVAKFKLDELEAKLSRTKIVTDAKLSWRANNMRARLFRLNMVFISLAVPKHWCKRGLVDLRDIKELPLSLVCWVLIPATLNVLIIMSVYFVQKYGGISP